MERGGTRQPSVAIGVKAAAISSGVTSNVPRAIDGTGSSGLSRPQRRAVRTTSRRPISWAARIVGTLSDIASAWRALTGPRNSWSKFCGDQAGCPDTSSSRGESSRTVAAVKLESCASCDFRNPAR